MKQVTQLDIETLPILPVCATYSDLVLTGWVVQCNYQIMWMAYDPLKHKA